MNIPVFQRFREILIAEITSVCMRFDAFQFTNRLVARNSFIKKGARRIQLLCIACRLVQIYRAIPVSTAVQHLIILCAVESEYPRWNFFQGFVITPT